ncbi:hypothetical protein [Novilysobacter spongiicola]|uniref:Uncharacterized protein n=1 Tax=Lysobacter spongiicola DSM 21749 TaxID=1122188 RepID=A0A1T4SJR2_9GAMM|nr:hypothetical protein [Lysobacter spongiicola]SKA28534.1 hypothetical protein SAMN02745674_02923 [Lysobacter spongiicola DSM 21749]
MATLNGDDAKTIKRLEEAACEHGVVMDLLGAIEDWQASGRPDEYDMHFFELAALAAALAREERSRRGLDKDSD